MSPAQRPRSARPAPPRTFVAAIRQWPLMLDLARDLGISYYTVAAWRQRDSIPPLHWEAVARAGRARHLRGVTVAALRAMYHRRWPTAPLPAHLSDPIPADSINSRTVPAQDARHAHFRTVKPADY